MDHRWYTRARFAQQTQGVATVQLKIDIVDGHQFVILEGAAKRCKYFAQSYDLQQGLRAGGRWRCLERDGCSVLHPLRDAAQPKALLRHARTAAEQGLGVGILGVHHQRPDGPGLTHSAFAQNHGFIGHLTDGTQIFGQQQKGHAAASLQMRQELQNITLMRDVQTCSRRVGNEQFRLTRQRHGNHHTMQLAARQFMRVGLDDALRRFNAHLVQHVHHARQCFCFGQFPLNKQHFRQLGTHAVQGVHRSAGIFENHGHASATYFLPLRWT